VYSIQHTDVDVDVDVYSLYSGHLSVIIYISRSKNSCNLHSIPCIRGCHEGYFAEI